MPLSTPTAAAVPANATTTPATAHLQAGRENCIGVRLVNKVGNVPAHIVLTRGPAAETATSVCAQVVGSQVVTDYLNLTSGSGTAGTIAVGSSRGIYRAAPPPRQPETGTPGGEGAGAPAARG